MADTFLFELVSPEELLLTEQVTEVVLPASEGYLTVMVNHAPTMTSIVPGIIKVKPTDGDEKSFVVFGGFADITPTGCSLLAESAISVEQFDHADLEDRIERARHSLENANGDEARNKAEDFLHQLTTVRGVLTMA
ncbi:F0F1 ATP synthase subunit epsilon [Bartonella tamiae]|uniref:ATP synthase epsilon chain n=1 Tax=Bartonella tamiae Th239 TaxID=1094558 RepID=J1K212_9HYPH|nr:F0F1 ATP synthase subunit epsilon [Bartonella tamiae]EJF91482.1 ATP synthase F1, epsilon subunit [Bartonella tamiae Th239]EJF92534.1 ATP synthase F1, epsilon subunit [Bartonella tamiae Th307]